MINDVYHVGFGRVNNEAHRGVIKKESLTVGSIFSANREEVNVGSNFDDKNNQTKPAQLIFTVQTSKRRDPNSADGSVCPTILVVPRPQLHNLKKLRVAPQMMVKLPTCHSLLICHFSQSTFLYHDPSLNTPELFTYRSNKLCRYHFRELVPISRSRSSDADMYGESVTVRSFSESFILSWSQFSHVKLSVPFPIPWALIRRLWWHRCP